MERYLYVFYILKICSFNVPINMHHEFVNGLFGHIKKSFYLCAEGKFDFRIINHSKRDLFTFRFETILAHPYNAKREFRHEYKFHEYVCSM